MARTLAALPESSKFADYISLAVNTKTFPLKQVRCVLAATGKASQRERDLPGHVVVYYAIAHVQDGIQNTEVGQAHVAPLRGQAVRDLFVLGSGDIHTRTVSKF